MKYEAPKELSHEAVEELVRANEPAALGEAVIGLSLADPDVVWTTAFLLRLVTHAEPGVRGAALLGLGHLSRRFRALPDSHAVAAAIRAGLKDGDAWVRGQADAAADDFGMFIGPLWAAPPLAVRRIRRRFTFPGSREQWRASRT